LTLDTKGKVKDRNLCGANQDELIVSNDQFTLCDHLGSVRDIVNADGKIVNHIEYNAFGRLLNATGNKPLFCYTGKFFDDVTGLQWNINRWYDSTVGRWCSEDPIGFEGKDENLFRYVNDNSSGKTDRMGLKPNFVCRCCARAAGAATRAESEHYKKQGLWDHEDDYSGGNAMKHCIANCRTAKLCGVKCAKDFWDDFFEEGDQGIESRQDYANNAVGRNQASGSNCVLDCLTAWINGQLTCQSKTDPGTLVPCPSP
jgi:RHS repeat-associated protein